MLQHAPHTAPTELFYTRNLLVQLRPTDVLLVGTAGKTVYPLRFRLKAMLEAGIIPGGNNSVYCKIAGAGHFYSFI